MPLVTEPADLYHSTPGYSKSTLWRFATMTPYRAQFGAQVSKPEFDVGHAAHTAILEPEKLEASIIKGPEDRRGNKWKFALEEAEEAGKILLTESDYEQVMLIREAAAHVPELEAMRRGSVHIETSCYAEDEETGATIKCRPDLYNADLKGMLDIKNLADISDDAWSRDIGKWGYHMQAAMYPDVWQRGSGMETDFFFFICFSKTEPVEVVCREIEPIDIEEGYLAYRHWLARAVEYEKAGHYPSYMSMSERRRLEAAGELQPVRMRDRDRKHTPPQWREGAEE